MNEKYQRGGRAYHSVLEPHFAFIRDQRQRRKTWQEIADLLHTEKGIRVTLYAPYHFYRRKLNRAKQPHWEKDADQFVSQPALSLRPPGQNHHGHRPKASTRHDARLSVEAGFVGRELSALWPARDDRQLTEHSAMLFTHFFAAARSLGQ